MIAGHLVPLVKKRLIGKLGIGWLVRSAQAAVPRQLRDFCEEDELKTLYTYKLFFVSNTLRASSRLRKNGIGFGLRDLGHSGTGGTGGGGSSCLSCSFFASTSARFAARRFSFSFFTSRAALRLRFFSSKSTLSLRS